MPDVAVVIAAQQAARHLATALASIAGQCRPAEEVVVVDDASTDDTASIAEAWTGRLPVQVLRLDESRGPGGARHEGIVATRAALIALLDADDVWLPDHLATMVAAYERQPGLVTADALRWIPGLALDGRPESSRALGAVPPADRQLPALLGRNYVFTGALFAREVYDGVGGFRPELRLAEDWDLWIRMVRAGASVSRPGHPTVLRRLRTGSASDTADLAAAQRRVLELAMAEATAPDERRAARRGLRLVAAGDALLRSYALAGDGRRWVARRTALRATVGGPARVAARAMLMVLAPATVARRRDAVRGHPWWRLRR